MLHRFGFELLAISACHVAFQTFTVSEAMSTSAGVGAPVYSILSDLKGLKLAPFNTARGSDNRNPILAQS